jgi:flagellar biosynthesis protein FlhG
LANYDQAAGLRRMLENPKPRVFTFLSALHEEEKSGVLINLAAALAVRGMKTLIVDARSSSSSVGAWVSADTERTLLDVARQQRTIHEVIKQVSSGLSVTMLSKHQLISANIPPENCRRLSRVFDVAAHRSDLVLVDAHLDIYDSFPLASFDDSELVIQVSADSETIKSAYGIVKRLSNRIGRRSYSILVTGADEYEAKRVFENLEQTARRYLAVPLTYLGYVPSDSYLRKATGLGRSVIDVFPLSKASKAFVRLADSMSTASSFNIELHQQPELGVHLKI